ncbi:MAG: ankyrin repeat domain-containing protein [Gammaproteobacteria bacterium]|nr:ankyrin repeat domain-containing protein [Gammaproteobacteria bacterium]
MLRDIFFEDEIDYFSETITSILNVFFRASKFSNDVIHYLHQFDADIKNNKKDSSAIIFTIHHMRECIVNYIVKHIIELTALEERLNIPANIKQREQDLTERLLVMDSPQLEQLISILSKLVYAVQNKSQYLKENHQRLIELEKDEDQQCDWAGDSRLILAIRRGDVQRALDFIGRNLFINRKNKFQQTPLILAASSGLNNVVQALCKHGAELDAHTGRHGTHETALYHAILYSKQSTAIFLLSQGAKVYFKWMNVSSNQVEEFSLLAFAKEANMNLTPPAENAVILSSYVTEVIKNNTSCVDIMRWLKTHECSLEKFLHAYMQIKYGEVNPKIYEMVIKEFKEKHAAEIEVRYRNHHLFKSSPLMQAVMGELKQEQKNYQPSMI